MGRRGLPFLVGLTAGVLFGAGQASATTMTQFTTSYSTWDSSSYITNPSNPTDLNLSFSPSGYISPGDPVSGFLLSGSDKGSYYLHVTSGVFYLNGNNIGSQKVLAGPNDGLGNLSVAAPSGGESAMLVWITTTASTPITATLSDGETYTFSTSSSTLGAFGFAAPSAMSSATFSTSSGSQVELFDVVYGTSAILGSGGSGAGDPGDSPAPESATIALAGGAMLTLFGVRRKCFSKTAA